MKDKKKTKHMPDDSSLDETMFKIMAEKSPNMIFVNKGGRVIYANEQCEEIMGYSREEFYSPDFYFLSLIAPESLELVKDNFLRHMKGEEVPPSIYSLITKDGQKIDAIHATSLISLDNEMAILGIITDVTEQKRVEDDLRKSREHYQLLLDISPDAIVETRIDGKIIFCNQRKSQLFGYDRPEELIGADSLQFIPPADMVIARNNAEELLEKGFMNNVQYTMLRKDGSHMDVEVNARLVRDIDGTPTSFLGSIRDISERKESEALMQHMNFELNQKNKELEQILYVTSHDLRSPLVNIEGFSKELEYSLEELTSHVSKIKNAPGISDKIDKIVHQDIPESMKFIMESAKKMNGLISGILKLSRTGKVELKIEEINMDRMVRDILLNFEFILHEKGINTNISSMPVCRGDVHQLGQLFANLIDNAIKYLDSERSGLIQISGYKDNDQSVYCIEDNGIGIAPEYQSRIFEIFHQLDPGTCKGEGLGLTIAHRIVEMHKGKIWIESEPEKGSRFFISIPVKS